MIEFPHQLIILLKENVQGLFARFVFFLVIYNVVPFWCENVM